MRLFYAIDLPRLPPWSGAMPPEGSASSPTHLTLEFLGDVPPERLDALYVAGDAAVAELAPFDVELERVGAFPSERSPRIVWVGVDRGGAALEELQRRLASALRGSGIPTDPRPFVPHVTWRRLRGPSDATIAHAHLAEGRLATPIRARVDRIVLQESELRPDGAVHRTLREFRLALRA